MCDIHPKIDSPPRPLRLTKGELTIAIAALTASTPTAINTSALKKLQKALTNIEPTPDTNVQLLFGAIGGLTASEAIAVTSAALEILDLELHPTDVAQSQYKTKFAVPGYTLREVASLALSVQQKCADYDYQIWTMPESSAPSFSF